MSVHLSWTTGRILQEDVELLAAPRAWLNDSCVAYFMQWLSLALDLNTAPTSSTAAGFVLMDPCCGFMLQYEDDVEDIDLDSVNLDPADQFFFLPVNDGDICADSYSGTHWSLLVWAPYGKFYMFDSAGGAPNSPNVKATAAGLAKYFLHNSSSDRKLQLPDHIAEVFRRPLEITSVKCSQQTNGYDCGVFVCAFTEHLVSKLRHVRVDNIPDATTLEHAMVLVLAFDGACKSMLTDVTQSHVSERRKGIHASLFAAETTEMFRKVSVKSSS